MSELSKSGVDSAREQLVKLIRSHHPPRPVGIGDRFCEVRGTEEDVGQDWPPSGFHDGLRRRYWY